MLHDMTQSVLDQAPDAILVADQWGTVLYANRHVESLFGFAPAELVGRNLNLLIPPPLRESHDGSLRRIRESGSASIFGLRREVPGYHRDGRELDLELHVSPLRNEGEPRFIATLSDIADRKRTEWQCRLLTETLSAQNQKLRGLLQSRLACDESTRDILTDASRRIRAVVAAVTSAGHPHLGEFPPGPAAPARRVTVDEAAEELLSIACDLFRHSLTIPSDANRSLERAEGADQQVALSAD